MVASPVLARGIAETLVPSSTPQAASTAASEGVGTLELAGLQRSFGSYNALRGIDLTITPGEFVALLGPSGCGKTTALNCIAGLMPLTGGSISLAGRRIDHLPPEERGFGMVFQSYALFPHMTARKNVGFGLAMRKVPRAEAARRIDEALSLVRLNAQADKLPGQMSGGQQQRVAIARAIVIRPPVVLMDEPLSNLDAKLRLEMRAEIRRIHDAIGSTTIYVTHDQDEALSMADRIVVMHEGSIRQTGTPDTLYERPLHADVAEFMGFRTRIIGRVTAADGVRVIVETGGALIEAVARNPVSVGQTVTLMIRPEDFLARSVEVRPTEARPAEARFGEAGLDGVARTIEYRGRAFFGTASLEGERLVFFRSEERLLPGQPIRLSAQPSQILVFAGDGS
jgi:putative spermidine/putrescine transport system ATP-binding protein